MSRGRSNACFPNMKTSVVLLALLGLSVRSALAETAAAPIPSDIEPPAEFEEADLTGPLGPMDATAPVNATTIAPPAGTCKGDGEYACPARDAVKTVFRDGYDPAAVDWNAVVADIVAIGTQEPRFCNFAIRSWFHDVSGFSDGQVSQKWPWDGASDGSFITDFNELDQPQGALHGFGQFTRHVLLQMAAAHGASHADLLTVAAAKCTTEILGGTVDIAQHCENVGLPLSVGRMDWTVNPEYEDWMWRHKASNPPRTHHKLAKVLDFFMKDINGFQPDAAWHVGADEVMALMGAHAIMMTLGCTTTADTGENSTVPDLGDRTCRGAGGRQRMFTWDNSFFQTMKQFLALKPEKIMQDVTVGTCFQTNRLIKGGDFGPKMSEPDLQALTQCGFKSMEGFELTEQLECSAMKTAIAKTLARDNGQEALETIEKLGAFNEGWQHVVWGSKSHSPKIPINASAPCCGYQCQSCADDPDSKFWCKGLNKEHEAARMWPYTYMDCEFNKIINMGAQGYCDGVSTNGKGKEILCSGCKKECEEKWGEDFGNPVGEIVAHLTTMVDSMMLFRENRAAWEETYATAFCKLSNFGATYAPNKVTFQSQFTGVTTGCLSVGSVLSPKQCEVCELPKFATLNDAGPLAPANPPPADPVELPPDVPVGSAPAEPGDAEATGPEASPIDVDDAEEIPVDVDDAILESDQLEPSAKEAEQSPPLKIAEKPEPVPTPIPTPTPTPTAAPTSQHSNFWTTRLSQWLTWVNSQNNS